jgi:hypothetical protein
MHGLSPRCGGEFERHLVGYWEGGLEFLLLQAGLTSSTSDQADCSSVLFRHRLVSFETLISTVYMEEPKWLSALSSS